MENDKARLNGAISLIIYLIDVLLVAIFTSCAIAGSTSTVTKVFIIETFVMVGIGFAMILRAGRYDDLERRCAKCRGKLGRR